MTARGQPGFQQRSPNMGMGHLERCPPPTIWPATRRRGPSTRSGRTATSRTRSSETPLAEAAAEDLAALDREEATRFIEIGMNAGALDAAPATLRAFFSNAEIQPEWLDYETFPPGVRMFHRNSYVVLVAFVAGVLIEGFTTNIAQSFMLTGRGARQGRQAPGAEQPAHDRDLLSRRPGPACGRLEAVGPHPVDPRAVEAPAEHLGGMGRRGLGHADQRGPSGFLHRRRFPPGC